VALAGTFGLHFAHADIFTWVDASGIVNVSNLAPPEGVRVTNIVHEDATKIPPRDSARQAELQALAQRVRQLEDQVATANLSPPPQVVYQSIAPPSAPQYAGNWAAPPAQYAYSDAPSTSAGCDPAWMNCGYWWGPGIYPASVIVLRAPKFRRFFPPHVDHRFAAHQPAHPPGRIRQG
jgi:hypothetical protein